MKKKPFYTRWWVWVLAIILVAFFIVGIPLLINECYNRKTSDYDRNAFG